MGGPGGSGLVVELYVEDRGAGTDTISVEGECAGTSLQGKRGCTRARELA